MSRSVSKHAVSLSTKLLAVAFLMSGALTIDVALATDTTSDPNMAPTPRAWSGPHEVNGPETVSGPETTTGLTVNSGGNLLIDSSGSVTVNNSSNGLTTLNGGIITGTKLEVGNAYSSAVSTGTLRTNMFLQKGGSAKFDAISYAPKSGSDGGPEFAATNIYVGSAYATSRANTLSTTTFDIAAESVRPVSVTGTLELAQGGKITIAGGTQNGAAKRPNKGFLGETLKNADKPIDGTTGTNTGKFNMTGGDLVLGADSNSSNNYGAFMQFNEVNISGGTATLHASEAGPNWYTLTGNTSSTRFENQWEQVSYIYGGKVTISDSATINLLDRSFIGSAATYLSTADKSNAGIKVTGGTINMNGSAGKESIIRAHANAYRDRTASQGLNNSKIEITNGKINVGGQGVILSRQTNLNGGEINVTGKLTVAGSAGLATSTPTDVNNAKVISAISGVSQNGAPVVKWGDFNFGGGTMIAQTGLVDFVTGDMTLNATSGKIDGNLTITTAAPASGAGVYATNLNVLAGASGDTFTVGGNLNVDVTSLTTTNDAAPGVKVAGTLVVKGTTDAVSNVAEGALNITGSGSVTGKLEDYATITHDANTLDVTSATADVALAKALKNSTGTLNLNSGNTTVAPNMTTEQYNKLKADLGLANGKLNLLNIIIDDQVEVKTDSSGNVNTEINNAASEVKVDAGATGNKNITFQKDVTVKDIIIENGSDVSSITAADDITFTGSGVSTPLVQGGAKSDIDLTAQGDVTLGLAGNNNTQGGILGDIVMKTDPAKVTGGTAVVDVNDGVFSVGAITVDSGATNSANMLVDVARSGAGGQTTQLNADSIDFGNLNVARQATVNADGAAIAVAGDITLNDNAKSGVNAVDGGTVTAANVVNATTVAATDGDITVKDTLSFSDAHDASVAVAGGTLKAGDLQLGNKGGWILVGNQQKQGALVAGNAALRGATIFSDPAWSREGANDFKKASAVVIKKFANDVMDGSVIAGQNSYFLYGSEDKDWMAKRVAEAGTWGTAGADNRNPITAALGLFRPLVVGKGQSLTVDGSLVAGADGRPVQNGSAYTPVADSATFAADSLMVVNAGDADIRSGKAALSAEKSSVAVLNVDKGAKLYLYNGRNGQQVNLVSGFGGNAGQNNGSGVIGVDAWTGEGIYTDSSMVTVAVDGSNGTDVTATAYARSARDVFPRISSGVADTLDWVYGVDGVTEAMNDVFSLNDGVRFVSRATSRMFNDVGLDGQSASVEGAAQMAALGGAPLNAFNIMRMNQNAISQRFSFSSGMSTFGGTVYTDADDSAIACVPGNGVAIWAGPVYEHGRVRGMDVGAFSNSYKSNLGGANLGIDFTRGDNVRFGVMGSVGGGKNKARGGDFAYTENKFDYFSVTGFAGWSTNNFSLLLDGGFTRVQNKVSQSSFDGGLRTRANVHAWDVGLTAEYKLAAGFADIIPHAGVRYQSINTRGHNVRYAGGGDIFEVGKDTQHLLTIPVGVSVVKNINFCNGWNMSPFVDAGALIAVGDRSYKTDTRLAGVDMPRFGYRTKMVDGVAFDGSAGLNVDNGRVFGGVNYNITHSKNQTTHGFWANVGVSF